MIVHCGMPKNVRIQHTTSPITATKYIVIKIYKYLCYCKRHKEEKGSPIQRIKCVEKNIVMIYIRYKIKSVLKQLEMSVMKFFRTQSSINENV